jgi:hypothetical protein
MTLVQGLAAAATIGILLALGGLVWPHVSRAVLDVARAVRPSSTGVSAAAGLLGQWGGLIALAAGLWLVLAPLAVYVLLRDDRP